MASGELLHELRLSIGMSNESNFHLFKGLKSNAISLATLRPATIAREWARIPLELKQEKKSI